MIFTNFRTNSTYNPSQDKNNQIMGFSKKYTMFKINKVNIVEVDNPIVIVPEKKTMLWGEPIWNLFHILSINIKDEYFQSIKSELISIIIKICNNLPCPDCTSHASDYIIKTNFDKIQSNNELIFALFTFHNSVNARKGLPIYNIDDLNSRYSTMNTSKVIQDFMVAFQDKHFSIRMIANDFHRNMLASQLKEWFNSRIQCFN